MCNDCIQPINATQNGHSRSKVSSGLASSNKQFPWRSRVHPRRMHATHIIPQHLRPLLVQHWRDAWRTMIVFSLSAHFVELLPGMRMTLATTIFAMHLQTRLVEIKQQWVSRVKTTWILYYCVDYLAFHLFLFNIISSLCNSLSAHRNCWQRGSSSSYTQKVQSLQSCCLL